VKKTTIVLAALALALSAPAMADHPRKGGKGKDKSASAEMHQDQGRNKGKGQGGKKFNGDERDEIVRYFGAHPSAREQLPPGLARKNKIPPGWQKKIGVGQRIPDDVWAYRVPLPHEVLVKLPPPPPGVIHVRIHDHVLKVIEETHEVLDKIGLPHPPTPRR
jgi:hypothetical protein